MTIHFASSEDIDFTLVSGADVNTSNSFDPNYSRCAVRSENSNEKITAQIGAGISTLYMSMRWTKFDPHSSVSDNQLFVIKDGSTNVARLKATNGTYTLETWDSGWQVRATSSINFLANGTNRLTIKLVLHASAGEFTLWIEDGLAATFTGDTIGDTGASTVDNIILTNVQNASASSFSEIIIADEQTINMRVATLVPSSDGTNTDWTNGWAAVDEAANSPADTIQSSSADDVETMNLTNYAGSTDLTVRAVFVSAKAIRGVSGPQNLQLAVREGASEAFSANKALDLVYTTYKNKFTVNPDSTPWTLADLDSLQAGVKSIT